VTQLYEWDSDGAQVVAEHARGDHVPPRAYSRTPPCSPTHPRECASDCCSRKASLLGSISSAPNGSEMRERSPSYSAVANGAGGSSILTLNSRVHSSRRSDAAADVASPEFQNHLGVLTQLRSPSRVRIQSRTDPHAATRRIANAYPMPMLCTEWNMESLAMPQER